MKTLIIESNTYLAQSIANRLIDKGHECQISRDANLKNDMGNFYDVVLIDYGVCTKSCPNVVRLFAGSVILMLIDAINDDTVTQMFKAGMDDFILKPVVMDELIRKIEHYKYFARLQQEVSFYKNYFEFIEGILNTPFPFTYNPPFIIRSTTQRGADIYAMRYARLKNIHFNFMSLKNIDWSEILKLNNAMDSTIYLTGLEALKKTDRNEFLEKLKKQNVLLSFVGSEEIPFSNIVDISNPQSDIDLNGKIIPIKDYEKMVIAKYESLYSDIELARELGISRKSLWEKRKRYGLVKRRGMRFC